MNHSSPSLYRRAALIALIAAGLAQSACIYRIPIQQGNRLEDEAVEQIEVGMSRSAVEFLLGTPMVADPFHAQRWDYPYYFKANRKANEVRRWVVVYFEDDRVARIDRDLTLEPSS